MLIDLKRILNENSQKYEERDFLLTANLIRSKQFIWSDVPKESKAFRIVTTHIEYFTSLFAAFGDHFIVDHQYGYCGIIPSLSQRQIGKLDTIYLLILARMHDSQIRKGAVEFGRSHPPAEILLDEFAQLMPNTNKPTATETKQSLKRLETFGVIKLGEVQEYTKLYDITILPSIMRAVTKDYIELLKQFMTESGSDIDFNFDEYEDSDMTEEQDDQNDD